MSQPPTDAEHALVGAALRDTAHAIADAAHRADAAAGEAFRSAFPPGGATLDEITADAHLNKVVTAAANACAVAELADAVVHLANAVTGTGNHTAVGQVLGRLRMVVEVMSGVDVFPPDSATTPTEPADAVES